MADSFGHDLYIQIKPFDISEQDIQKIADLGFGGVRFSIRWDQVEKKYGKYSYEYPIPNRGDRRTGINYEWLIDALAKRNLNMIIVFYGGNPIYTGPYQDFSSPHKSSIRKRLLLPPVNSDEIAAFSSFAAHTVDYFSKKYGNDRFIWTIWNEPNLWTFYPPAPNPAAFSKLITKSCVDIKAAVPDAFVAGPGFAAAAGTMWEPDLKFASKMLEESNSLGCLNSITFHPYRPVHPETFSSSYSEIKRFIEAWQPPGLDVSIGVDEWGYSINKSPFFPVDVKKQAVYLQRAYLINQMLGVSYTNIYEWKDSGKDQNEREHNFGLIDYEGKPKPAFEAFAFLLKDLKGYSFEKRLHPEDCSNDVYALLYRSRGLKKVVVWRISDDFSKLYTENKVQVDVGELAKVFPVLNENLIKCGK